MVYRGKLSAGCEPCRSRGTKCDLVRNGCSQCAKRGTVCDGYREVTQLRVVDETARFSRKAASGKGSGKAGFVRHGHCKSKEVVGALPISILPTIEDTAHSFFFVSYVPGNHFGYLPGLVHAAALATPLKACVQAVAVASFSNERHNRDMMKVALKHYSVALRETKAAMSSSLNIAAQNSTIACVLLLGLFEALCHSGQTNPRNYTAHNDGALALLDLRGPDLVQTEIGYQLFMHVSSNIRVSCIVHHKRTPPCLVLLHKRMLPFIDQEDPNVRFFSIIDDFAELQAGIAESNIQQGSPLATAFAASRIESRCEMLMATVRDSWRYTVHVSDHDDVVPFGYEHETHLYPDAYVAQWWNSVRQTRIYLNQIVLDQLRGAIHEETDSYFLQDMQLAAIATTRQLAADICASIPQFAQAVHENRASKTATTTTLAMVSRLFFPLCTVGNSMVVPESMRHYAARSLWYLGTAAKFPQAVDAAKMIEDKSLDTSW